VRRLLSILLVISVLWCGLELCPPALAHGAIDQAAVNATPEDSSDRHAGPLEAVHAGHHHCPLATNLGEAAVWFGLDSDPGLRWATRIQPLASRTEAPRPQPPAA
jgi:hypothetical protein